LIGMKKKGALMTALKTVPGAFAGVAGPVAVMCLITVAAAAITQQNDLTTERAVRLVSGLSAVMTQCPPFITVHADQAERFKQDFFDKAVKRFGETSIREALAVETRRREKEIEIVGRKLWCEQQIAILDYNGIKGVAEEASKAAAARPTTLVDVTSGAAGKPPDLNSAGALKRTLGAVLADTKQDNQEVAREVPPASKPAAGFVFDGTGVVNPANPRQYLRVGERVSRRAMRKRFAGYRVKYARNDAGCAPCAGVTGKNGSLFIQLSDDRRTVKTIESNDNKARDVFGNAVRNSLRKAVGSATAQCQDGTWGMPMCAAPNQSGLWYYADIKSDDCPIIFREDKISGGPLVADIPACSTISSFSVVNTAPEPAAKYKNISGAAYIEHYVCVGKRGHEPYSLTLDFIRSVLTFKGLAFKELEAVDPTESFGEWRAGVAHLWIDDVGSGGLEIKSSSDAGEYDCRLSGDDEFSQ